MFNKGLLFLTYKEFLKLIVKTYIWKCKGCKLSKTILKKKKKNKFGGLTLPDFKN